MKFQQYRIRLQWTFCTSSRIDALIRLARVATNRLHWGVKAHCRHEQSNTRCDKRRDTQGYSSFRQCGFLCLRNFAAKLPELIIFL